MSEYQYYEFLAIDRPLTEEETTELRALSTRTVITPVSFTNEYHWGDFKGDPKNLMQRYFDAHVYVANWGTAIFILRLPIETLTQETVKAVAVPSLFDIKPTDTHWIISWILEESENYNRFGIDDGRGGMVRLAPIREELLRGDLRGLYIGWLATISREIIDDPKAWASVEGPVERGSGRGYDEACRMLVDIAEAYNLYATREQFQNKLKKFMAGHMHRKALIQRLVKAGIFHNPIDRSNTFSGNNSMS